LVSYNGSMSRDELFNDRDDIPAKSTDISCPAYEECTKLGTAMDSCRMINKLMGSSILPRPIKSPDLHNMEGYSEDRETPEDWADMYQQALDHYDSSAGTDDVVELRRVYEQLRHMQCCLSSIVLLLARKST